MTEGRAFLGSPPRARLVRVVLLALFAGSLVVVAAGFLAIGGGYWLLPPEGRKGHYLDAFLEPGGPGGLALGFLGTALMLGMLLYGVRKRFVRAAWPGPLSGWLAFHIVCGVMGPLLILIHGGLRLPRGLVAVAFWCMVLVALSGLFGRYLYGMFPRGREGREGDLVLAREALAETRALLVARTAGAEDPRIAEAVGLARELDMRMGGLADLVAMSREVRRRARRIRSLLGSTDLRTEDREAAATILVRQLEIRRGLEALDLTRRLFRWWHLFHQPLARAMYLLAGVHVAMAILYGGALSSLGRFMR